MLQVRMKNGLEDPAAQPLHFPGGAAVGILEGAGTTDADGQGQGPAPVMRMNDEIPGCDFIEKSMQLACVGFDRCPALPRVHQLDLHHDHVRIDMIRQVFAHAELGRYEAVLHRTFVEVSDLGRPDEPGAAGSHVFSFCEKTRADICATIGLSRSEIESHDKEPDGAVDHGATDREGDQPAADTGRDPPSIRLEPTQHDHADEERGQYRGERQRDHHRKGKKGHVPVEKPHRRWRRSILDLEEIAMPPARHRLNILERTGEKDFQYQGVTRGGGMVFEINRFQPVILRQGHCRNEKLPRDRVEHVAHIPRAYFRVPFGECADGRELSQDRGGQPRLVGVLHFHDTQLIIMRFEAGLNCLGCAPECGPVLSTSGCEVRVDMAEDRQLIDMFRISDGPGPSTLDQSNPRSRNTQKVSHGLLYGVPCIETIGEFSREKRSRHAWESREGLAPVAATTRHVFSVELRHRHCGAMNAEASMMLIASTTPAMNLLKSNSSGRSFPSGFQVQDIVSGATTEIIEQSVSTPDDDDPSMDM